MCDTYTKDLERQVVLMAKQIIGLEHQLIAVGGTFCICDHCAPTENSKSERRALTAALAERHART